MDVPVLIYLKTVFLFTLQKAKVLQVLLHHRTIKRGSYKKERLFFQVIKL